MAELPLFRGTKVTNKFRLWKNFRVFLRSVAKFFCINTVRIVFFPLNVYLRTLFQKRLWQQ